MERKGPLDDIPRRGITAVNAPGLERSPAGPLVRSGGVRVFGSCSALKCASESQKDLRGHTQGEKAPSAVESLGPFQANHRGNRRVPADTLAQDRLTNCERQERTWRIDANDPSATWTAEIFQRKLRR